MTVGYLIIGGSEGMIRMWRRMRSGTYNVLEEVDYRVVITRPAVLRPLGDGAYMAGPGCMYILQQQQSPVSREEGEQQLLGKAPFV